MSPSYSPAGSKSSSPETVGLQARVQEAIIGHLRKAGGKVAIKELVDRVKPMFVGAEEKAEMKTILKSVLKKVGEPLDKSSGCVELKSTYR
jgi:hypothetical protein